MSADTEPEGLLNHIVSHCSSVLSIKNNSLTWVQQTRFDGNFKFTVRWKWITDVRSHSGLFLSLIPSAQWPTCMTVPFLQKVKEPQTPQKKLKSERNDEFLCVNRKLRTDLQSSCGHVSLCRSHRGNIYRQSSASSFLHSLPFNPINGVMMAASEEGVLFPVPPEKPGGGTEEIKLLLVWVSAAWTLTKVVYDGAASFISIWSILWTPAIISAVLYI